MPPFFFLALILVGAGSIFGAVALWALSAIALGLVGWSGALRSAAGAGLSIPVIGFAVATMLSTLFVSPAYSAAGLYHPLLFALAFLTGRACPVSAVRSAMTVTAGLGLILAFWGLFQTGYIGVARAHGSFETPATYAAVINLMLIPALATIVVGKRHTLLLVVSLLLALAMFAADSRGGLIAMAAGIGCAFALAQRIQKLTLRPIIAILVILATAWAMNAVLRAHPGVQPEAGPTAEARVESSISRLELYALSWDAWRERPLTGTGYLTFRYTLEQGREKVPSYGASNETWFVHNDYLQTLQELGPLGLIALVGITALPLILAYRRLPAIPDADRPVVIATASGLAGMSVHALVDYPFYVPICLVLYGALLGVLDRRLYPPVPATASTWTTTRWFKGGRAALLTVVGVILIRPVLAEAAAEWGLRQNALGESQRSAFWLGAAQRLDPRDWRYHWYAGQFWDAQAAESGKPEAARLAATAFANGFKANPLEVRNLLGMISVHRRYAHLLETPADAQTLASWRTRAAELAPLNPAVRRELAQ